jgi:hypothetical protein
MADATKRLRESVRPMLKGAASLFDFSGSLRPSVRPPRPRSPADDRASLARDWKKVGGDIRVATEKHAPRSRG